jgi:hypothetical protein
VSGLPPTFLADLLDVAQRARAHAIVLQLCLWSFDLCKGQSAGIRAALVADPANTASYVANALEPMLAALRGANLTGSVLFEVINEPEW